jgi:hypothetical protein
VESTFKKEVIIDVEILITSFTADRLNRRFGRTIRRKQSAQKKIHNLSESL